MGADTPERSGAEAIAGGRRPDRECVVAVAEDLRLHVSEWGDSDGWPVLILHGGAHSATHWADVCRRLPSRLRCFVPDQRGHGASDRAPDGDYSCAAQVGDLIALLSALSIDRCALVGHSMGGLNALRLAGIRPERVSALVLVDVATGTRQAGLAAVRRSRASVASGRETSSPRARFDARLLDFVPSYCGDEAERRRLLEASRAPLLVMRGERSRILSADEAERCAQIVGGSVVAISGAGHNVSLHDPAAVAEALWTFLGPLVSSEG